MPRHIPATPSRNALIIPAGDPMVADCYFRLVKLAAGETICITVPDFEILAVVMSGQVNIRVGATDFGQVGGRADIWSGAADSVYAGTHAEAEITGIAPESEIAIAGGRCKGKQAPFRIKPADVQVVAVGSVETHSHRQIFHILGQSATGKAGNLLVSELYAAPGCWSGYPPHKHDTERMPEESAFEEIYHYRFDPPSGFGGQYHYRKGEAPTAVMTRQGDTFVVEDGYHPTSTSPGHRGYIFTILVGQYQRSLVQYFDPAHEHLMASMPGLQAMRDKFRS